MQRLIDKCADQLYESYETINDLRAHDQLFTLNTVQKLDATRKKLSSIDHTLMDTQNIIRGFINFVTDIKPSREDDVYGEVSSDNKIIEPQNNVVETTDEEPDKEHTP